MFAIVGRSTPQLVPAKCVVRGCDGGHEGDSSTTTVQCKKCGIKASTQTGCKHGHIFACGHGFCTGCGAVNNVYRLFAHEHHPSSCVYRQQEQHHEFEMNAKAVAAIMTQISLARITYGDGSFDVAFSVEDLHKAKNMFDRSTKLNEHEERGIQPMTLDSPLCAHCGCGLSFWLTPPQWVNAVLCVPCFKRHFPERILASQLCCSAATNTSPITALLTSALRELQNKSVDTHSIRVKVPRPFKHRRVALPPISRQEFLALASCARDDDYRDVTIVGHFAPCIKVFGTAAKSLTVDGAVWKNDQTVTYDPEFAVQTSLVKSRLVDGSNIPTAVIREYINGLGTSKRNRKEKTAIEKWLNDRPAPAPSRAVYEECTVDDLLRTTQQSDVISKYILQPLEILRNEHKSICAHLNSTTVLLVDVCDSGSCGTMVHVDPASAVNMLISYEDEEVAPITPKASALWRLWPPSTSAAIVQYLRERQNPPELSPGCRFRDQNVPSQKDRNSKSAAELHWCDRENIPEADAQKISNEISEATGVKPDEFEQAHGDVICVPAGWFHLVSNKRACIKLAFDTVSLDDAPLISRVNADVISHLGPIQRDDYAGFFANFPALLANHISNSRKGKRKK